MGEEYARRAGVPQGDPLSMVITALLLSPRIMQIRNYGVIARVLADDLQIISIGQAHIEQIQRAYDTTHKHLADMAARIVPQKCVTCSTDDVVREWLRTHRWEENWVQPSLWEMIAGTLEPS